MSASLLEENKMDMALGIMREAQRFYTFLIEKLFGKKDKYLITYRSSDGEEEEEFVGKKRDIVKIIDRVLNINSSNPDSGEKRVVREITVDLVVNNGNKIRVATFHS